MKRELVRGTEEGAKDKTMHKITDTMIIIWIVCCGFESSRKKLVFTEKIFLSWLFLLLNIADLISAEMVMWLPWTLWWGRVSRCSSCAFDVLLNK